MSRCRCRRVFIFFHLSRDGITRDARLLNRKLLRHHCDIVNRTEIFSYNAAAADRADDELDELQNEEDNENYADKGEDDRRGDFMLSGDGGDSVCGQLGGIIVGVGGFVLGYLINLLFGGEAVVYAGEGEIAFYDLDFLGSECTVAVAF